MLGDGKPLDVKAKRSTPAKETPRPAAAAPVLPAAEASMPFEASNVASPDPIAAVASASMRLADLSIDIWSERGISIQIGNQRIYMSDAQARAVHMFLDLEESVFTAKR
jgi:hypothetical protein